MNLCLHFMREGSLSISLFGLSMSSKKLHPYFSVPSSLKVSFHHPFVFHNSNLNVLPKEEAIRTASNAIIVNVIVSCSSNLGEESALFLFYFLFIFFALYIFFFFLR